MSSTEQINAKKELIYNTLLELKEMKVMINDYLDEVNKKFENESKDDEKKEQNIKQRKIIKMSLLVNVETINKENKPSWCDKGHDLKCSNNGKWNNDKCNECGSNKGDVFICLSCSDYDKAFNKGKFDKTKSKYLWCSQCANKINPKNVKTEILRTNAIRKRVIHSTQINIDLLTGLKNKKSLNFLLNEISINNNKDRYSLYLFNIDEFKTLKFLNESLLHDDKILKDIGKTLNNFEQKTEKYFCDNKLGIKRCWCFRQGCDEFAIVTLATSCLIYKQEPFYLLFNKEIQKLAITISVGMCCMGLGFDYSSQNINKSQDWLIFADNALYEAKNSGKNGLRIYDNKQKKNVKGFTDYLVNDGW